jgi:hypothetical protein
MDLYLFITLSEVQNLGQRLPLCTLSRQLFILSSTDWQLTFLLYFLYMENVDNDYAIYYSCLILYDEYILLLTYR